MMDSVAAVVVTYNRANLLVDCLEALDAQSHRLTCLYVIDNASTDNTPEVVQAFSERASVPVRYRRLADNLGGAGGFSAGTRIAIASGVDWVWLMDDDGIPDSEALAAMLPHAEPAILNSLVTDIDNPERLAFTVEHFERVKTVAEAQAQGPLMKGAINPFNGTLVHRAVFDKIGFPYQGFFIWGDEVDFVERAKAAGFPIATVTGALHRHPANRKPLYRMFGRFNVNVVDDEKRLAIYLRNYSHNLYRYKGPRVWATFAVKQLAYEVLVRRSLRRFGIGVKAILNGIGGFSRETRSGAHAAFTPKIASSTDRGAAGLAAESL